MGGRLRKILEDSGLTRPQFCAAMGVARSTLANYLSGRRLPDVPLLARLVRRFGVAPDWLLCGEEPAYRRGFSRQVPVPGGEIIQIPAIAPILREGPHDLKTLLGNAENSYCFNFSWLAAQGPVDAMFVTTVSGDCMEPGLRNGDVLLVDSSLTALHPGRLYALVLNGAIAVRRVDAGVDGIFLHCENSAYPSVEIAGSKIGKLQVLGRVIWASKSFLP
ncbi:LexA family transcriptional regulator [Desulfovibrio sp. X2]|uniref:XRE family transcriptional regulator n=1 Tax=Desulfovibrio sp. X2 TaxID=941449 RepID=UPI00042379F4|nr:LexA family transcriptional regulator [Desulfovibrio sp. X2]